MCQVDLHEEQRTGRWSELLPCLPRVAPTGISSQAWHIAWRRNELRMGEAPEASMLRTWRWTSRCLRALPRRRTRQCNGPWMREFACRRPLRPHCDYSPAPTYAFSAMAHLWVLPLKFFRQHWNPRRRRLIFFYVKLSVTAAAPSTARIIKVILHVLPTARQQCNQFNVAATTNDIPHFCVQQHLMLLLSNNTEMKSQPTNESPQK